ncbi:MAG TPA: GMC family oxidoreductase [Bacteriovoracaceae bacterium]|nr:GMC family oxidoreductase [Bacteriovoracaceae bacterium]
MNELTVLTGDIPHVSMNHWQGMRSFLDSDEVDVVVIGTGAGGAPAMSRLGSHGLKVVALEAGKKFDPHRDFATDERSQSKLFWMHERVSLGKDPIMFGNNNSGKGVGGSTLHFTAYVPRPAPESLRLKSLTGSGEDWPVNFEELVDYLEEVEEFLGVSGPKDYPWGAKRRKSYPLAPLPLNTPARLMEKACGSIGIKTSAAANAALSSPYYQKGVGMRPACTNRGYCQVGCNTGAKSSMDVTYIPHAVLNGVEVREESFVTGFVLNGDQKKIIGVRYKKDGLEKVQRCKSVFLAAGGVESPRLLLQSGLANSSGKVGKNFMAHPGLEIWGTFDENTRPYRGIPGSLISEDFQKSPNGEYHGGYLLQSIGVMPVTFASQLTRGRKIFGNDLLKQMAAYTHVAGINMLGDCFPSDENFLTLSSEKDDLGLPKPEIHFSYGENEKNMIQHAQKVMTEIWEKAGAKDIWKFERSAHVIGTCRMGDDPSRSVVNRHGKCHDLENLYIVDNSIFPSALSVNPALTIMAMSLKITDHFIKNLKDRS